MLKEPPKGLCMPLMTMAVFSYDETAPRTIDANGVLLGGEPSVLDTVCSSPNSAANTALGVENKENGSR